MEGSDLIYWEVERGWRDKVSCYGLGKDRNKNDFKNDLPALKFVSGN